MQNSTCSVPECGRAGKIVRGYCALHYLRWQRHGDPLHVTPRTRNIGVATCSIDNCPELTIARGWCSKHWTRWQRYGDPLARVRGEIVGGCRMCPTCKTDKPLEEFFSGGRGGPCRTCASAYAQEWKLGNPDKVTANSHRRRARIRKQFVEDVNRSALMARDNYTCQLCMLPVDPSLTWPNHKFGTIDHIIPLIRGGEHSYANTQLAHYICNVRKGAPITA